jgi:hypothetical protein
VSMCILLDALLDDINRRSRVAPGRRPRRAA